MGRLKIISIYILVAVILLLPDMVFEWLMQVGHTLFEILEVSLDLIVEHAFHTDLHQTQVIVFYILFFMLLFWLRRLWRALPCYYQRILAGKDRKKAELTECWENMRLLKKIQIVGIAVFSATVLIFLLFL